MLKLLPRKEFELHFDGKTIKGQFGTWALKRFCDVQGYPLSGLADAFQGDKRLDDVLAFVLCAVEYKCKLDRIDFDYTDADVCDWMDRLGGIDSQSFVNLFNHSMSDIEVKKKAKVKA